MGLEEELERQIDKMLGKRDQRFTGFLQRLAGLLREFTDSSASEDALDDDDGSLGAARRVKQKRGKKKATADGEKRGKKKRGKKARTTRGASNTLNPDTREQILGLLMKRGPLRVTQLVEVTRIVQSTVNRHLNALLNEKLVTRVRLGNKVLYKHVHDGRAGRKTAEKESVAPPVSSPKPVAA